MPLTLTIDNCFLNAIGFQPPILELYFIYEPLEEVKDINPDNGTIYAEMGLTFRAMVGFALDIRSAFKYQTRLFDKVRLIITVQDILLSN